MGLIPSGTNWKGEPCEVYLDGYLEKNLKAVKDVVTTKDWDYVALVTGLPGSGKSNFAITMAKYLCPWFDDNYIAFDDNDFIDITTKAKKHSAVILDESFASLNSKVTMSKEFLRIINHLQIIRQKNLFIILVLPNFFDLNKGVAMYRSHHLFLCYGKEFGDRGNFCAFGREEKKQLYIKGLKFMNYYAEKANFHGKFFKQKVIDEEVYLQKKAAHLQRQSESMEKKVKASMQRDKLIAYVHCKLKVPIEEIIKSMQYTKYMVERAIKKYGGTENVA